MQTFAGKPRLGEWMLEKGMITSDQLAIALIEQQKDQLLLGQQLVRLHFVTDAIVRDVLAQYHVQDSVDVSQMVPDAEVVMLVPEWFARKHQLLPLSLSADKQLLRVAISDHKNTAALEALRQLLGGRMQFKTALATEADLEQKLDQYYGHSLSLDGILQEIEQGDDVSQPSQSQQSSRPVVRLVDAILVDAVKRGASDIHFEPELAFLRVRYRVDGVLWQIRCLHDRYWPAICVRIKIMAGMDIAEQRASQDGRIQLFLCGRQIDFRVSSHPTLHGENVVLRILDRDKAILTMEAMGLPSIQLKRIQSMLNKPEGLLMLTGPTGSGKTTTLYAMLAYLNHEHVNIMTLEDPVEYPQPLMRQTSVNAANKVDFVNGIRAILRQDPDIILVGEIRDESTAAMAVRAAMTGHLVLTSLHTNSAMAAFSRLQDLGVSAHMISSCLVGVIAQRLVRRLCQHCKRSVNLGDNTANRLVGASPRECDTLSEVFEATGCDRCHMSGYSGRLVVMEALAMHSGMAGLLSKSLPAEQFQQQARAHGFITLAEDGLRLVRSGETSLQELRRVVDLSVMADTGLTA